MQLVESKKAGAYPNLAFAKVFFLKKSE